MLVASLVALLFAVRQLHRAQTNAVDALAKVQSSEQFFSDSFHNNPVPCALANLKTHGLPDLLRSLAADAAAAGG